MVTSIALQTYGQPAVPVQGQESEDADEPPLPPLKKTHSLVEQLSIKDGSNPATAAASTIITVESKDATLVSVSSWDKSPATAHLYDAQDVAAVLDVDPL